MCADIKQIEKKLTDVLGDGKVCTEPDDLESFRIANPVHANGSKPTYAVKPPDVSSVQELVKLAFNDGFHIVPVSSSAPHNKTGISCSSEHIALDLSGWDKIHSIDRRNRVCMIDPGVTYGELVKALKPHGMTVSMPLAPRDGKSVLASVMDREPSTWPNRQWDAGDPVGSTEFIFGTGDLFRTGAAGGPGTIEQQRAVGGAQKSPTGPSQADFHRVLQGAQGSMGIVTWITVRCELKLSIQEPRITGADDLGKIIPFVYKVQRPWLGENSFILNRTSAAMLMSHKNPTTFDSIRDSLPQYICLQNIAGFERLAKERVGYQLEDIEDIASDTGVILNKSIGEIQAIDLLKTATRPCGVDDWRNALFGNCLRIFFLTTLDRTPDHIRIMKDMAKAHGLEVSLVGTYIQPIVQNHGCHVEFMLPFDPKDSSQIEKMRKLEAEAVPALADKGAFFSRPYGTAEKEAFKRNQMNFEVLKRIKNIFDPNRVFNPGKFGI